MFSTKSFAKSFVFCSLAALSIVGCSSTKKPVSSEVAEAAAPVKVDTPKSVSSNLQSVYFDFNKYTIRKDQLLSANQIAQELKNNSQLKVEIQGNTDDRGSVEYNLALGNKRAASLRDFLVKQGVSVNNLSTVSYGKEHPAVVGEGEEVWAKNRRDDVVIKN